MSTFHFWNGGHYLYTLTLSIFSLQMNCFAVNRSVWFVLLHIHVFVRVVDFYSFVCFMYHQKPLDVTNHSVAREVVTFFTLPPGDYVVVPQTGIAHCEGKFLLRIFTDEHSNIW